MLRKFKRQNEEVAAARKILADRIKAEGMVSKQMYMAEEMTDTEREASDARYEANKADEEAKAAADIKKRQEQASRTASPTSGVKYKPGGWAHLNFAVIEKAIEAGLSAAGKAKALISKWYGPIGYSYTGGSHEALEMSPGFANIARQLEKQLNKPKGYFNGVLVNRYKKGKGIGAHADNEGIYLRNDGTIGAIATISLGAQSTITLSRNDGTKEPHTFTVSNGDLYVMPDGDFQANNKHAVGAADGTRISLTFRHIPPENISAPFNPPGFQERESAPKNNTTPYKGQDWTVDVAEDATWQEAYQNARITNSKGEERYAVSAPNVGADRRALLVNYFWQKGLTISVTYNGKEYLYITNSDVIISKTTKKFKIIRL